MRCWEISSLRSGREDGPVLRRQAQGFTLIEILIVLSIISVLVSLAVPNYRRSILQAREAVLKENLYVLRSTIEQFTLDKQRPPGALDELVSEGYLRHLPADITGSTSTWQPVYGNLMISPEQTSGGLTDVHSGSNLISTQGTPYSSW